jgi:phage I-like protein
MRVLLAPWGIVESRSGTFVVDRESADAVLASFDEQGVELPVDYEHQTLGGSFASPTGQAPAAGWIRRLEVVEGEGIFGHVSWTASAAQQLAAREYRYVSPVALVRKSDRKLVALHSAALTNKPAIVGMQPIVNRQKSVASEENETMEEKLEVLRGVLGLDASAEVETVLVAATERLDTLSGAVARREAEDLVAGATEAGKLTASQRAWAVALAMKDQAEFEAWEASAPVVVTTGRTDPPDDGQRGDRTRQAVIAKARHEFRDHPELERLTSEAAFVDDAVRQAGLCAVNES